MQSAWSDEDAKAACTRWVTPDGRVNEALALRVYTSRLIGRQSSLVLHGGGNTSVKTTLADDLGDEVEVLCVKGSGWDLGDIEPAGFPAVRLRPLQRLRELASLSDEAMVNAARTRMLDASAPNPSVEVLLHAFLPHTYIDHSHADAILALVDQGEAESIAHEVFGERLAIVPYIMPGFALAKLAAEVYEAHPNCEGLLLLQHGLFTFGDTARQSYERHIEAVSLAERFIEARRARVRVAGPVRRAEVRWAELAPIVRGHLGEHERRWVMHLRRSDAIRSFVDHPALVERVGRGPATPDHVIRTKQLPVVVDVDASAGDIDGHVCTLMNEYRAAYRAYVRRHSEAKGVDRTPLDPDPRVLLLPGLGLVTVGKDANAARIAADIYEHTVGIIEDAEAVGRYQALPESDIFDMEYWSLEQAKLGKGAKAPLQRQIVYITGAASGIGAATARAFAAAGAQVFAVDRDAEGLAKIAEACKCPFSVVDVTDRQAVERSIGEVVETFGGLDGVVSNAGTAPQAAMHACEPEVLQGSLAVNLLSHQWVAAAATRVMRAQGMGGFLLFNASKAAFNPGEDFGPYAVAKAGLVALMKQYALENGRFGIRVNAVNADRIRSGLLGVEDVQARAEARGLSTDAYFRSNLLQQEVTADDVASAFVSLALARSTTGAVSTVDGGNIAASPR
jgi:rhamnose utilization protein RhaD (predicted bifunctional aldolase and dehydrogenase)/NAD(P)-dependent dehydrogenase (short-subunit alcohol dehydrogenase family)